MSQENVAIVRRAYEVVNETYRTGEFTAWNELLEQVVAPEIVLKPSGRFPQTDEWRGRDALRQFVVDQMEAFEAGTMWVETREYIDAGDRVIAPSRFGGRARHTGIEVDFEVTHSWKMRDGRVVRLEMFATKEEALEAAGLRD
jgi:ketosteroid isomerase-like protein